MSRLLFYPLVLIILFAILESEDLYSLQQLLDHYEYFKEILQNFFDFEP